MSDNVSITVWKKFLKANGSFSGETYVQRTGDSPPVDDYYVHQWVRSFMHESRREFTSNYNAKRAAGLFIDPLPYTTASSATSFTPSKDSAGADAHDWYNNQGGAQLYDPSKYRSDYQAITNFYAGLSRRSQVQLGVFLVELKESLGLVSKAIITLVSVIRALKRGRISDAIAILAAYTSEPVDVRRVKKRNRSKKDRISKSQYASEAWLELQFGWKPLIDDIYSIMDGLSERLNQASQPWFSISGYGSELVRDERTVAHMYDNRYILRKRSFTGSYTISNADIDFLQAFGLSDPAAIVWEVIPFSFVVDWFLPIGNWIESFSAENGLRRLGFSTAVKLSGSRETRFYENFHPTLDHFGAASKSTFATFNRQVVVNESELPPLPLQWVNPVDIFDGWHILTSLALFKAVSGR